MKKFTFLLLLMIELFTSANAQTSMAILNPVRPLQCDKSGDSCEKYDAIVFVHGIYGSEDTFRNPETGFYWPENIPQAIQGRRIDVFTISYQSALVNWANTGDNQFGSVTGDFFKAISPLSERKYRSIGFIAHSLGGNVVSTYIHKTKTLLGHRARAQNAYVITLATPISGAYIANIANILKSLLGMKDDLLSSLQKGNLYLDMLQRFRADEDAKALGFYCRPVHVHAAYETKSLSGITIVPEADAAGKWFLFESAPQPLQENHSTIAKPKDRNTESYKWVNNTLEREFSRLNDWHTINSSLSFKKQICNPPDDAI